MAVSTIGNCFLTVAIIVGIIVYRRGERQKPDSVRSTGALAIWLLGCAVIKAWTVWSINNDWSNWMSLVVNTWAAATVANMAWQKRSMPR